MSFQQRTNTSCHPAMPTRGFTAVVSVFGGTPPPKPLKCKIRFALSGGAMGRSWAHHTGDDSKPVFAKFSLSPDDITRMSRCSCSQTVRLSLPSFVFQCRGENKKPCLRSVSRVEKFQMILYLPTMGPTKLIPGLCPKYKLERPRPNATAAPTGRDQP